jgi:hypothetical protein
VHFFFFFFAAEDGTQALSLSHMHSKSLSYILSPSKILFLIGSLSCIVVSHHLEHRDLHNPPTFQISAWWLFHYLASAHGPLLLPLELPSSQSGYFDPVLSWSSPWSWQACMVQLNPVVNYNRN